MAIGTRLVVGGVIVEDDNIFWLYLNEILAALRAPAPTSLVQSVAERRVQYESWLAYEPPSILGLPRAKLDERPPFKDEVTEPTQVERAMLIGQAASPGVRSGRARIVPSTVLLPDLEPGDILIAENAGPAWTPMFPILGGLVLNGGVLTQHAATTAREYGVPAVIGTENATRRIWDGAWVTVDGTTGTVHFEDAHHERMER